MTRFSNFTDDELDAIEEAFCNERLKNLVFEVRREREYRESRKDEIVKQNTNTPKEGHWIKGYEKKENDLGVDYIPYCKCSKCGKKYDSHSSLFIKYCNECGAKMVEPCLKLM